MILPGRPTLIGRHARLEPLELSHADALFTAGQDERIWTHMPIPRPRSPEDTARWVRQALDRAQAGIEIPFAIFSVASDDPIGSTRYLDLQPENESTEIGWTWISSDHWRTTINTECKLLLLTQAFEVMKASRVQFKTDGRNARSQVAIERIGAKREGTLRRNRKNWDGFVRDTVYFSILDSEWPDVKVRLVGFLK